MKKAITPKKLKLDTSKLRSLTGKELDGVAGGDMVPTPPTRACSHEF